MHNIKRAKRIKMISKYCSLRGFCVVLTIALPLVVPTQSASRTTTIRSTSSSTISPSRVNISSVPSPSSFANTDATPTLNKSRGSPSAATSSHTLMTSSASTADKISPSKKASSSPSAATSSHTLMTSSPSTIDGPPTSKTPSASPSPAARSHDLMQSSSSTRHIISTTPTVTPSSTLFNTICSYSSCDFRTTSNLTDPSISKAIDPSTTQFIGKSTPVDNETTTHVLPTDKTGTTMNIPPTSPDDSEKRKALRAVMGLSIVLGAMIFCFVVYVSCKLYQKRKKAGRTTTSYCPKKSSNSIEELTDDGTNGQKTGVYNPQFECTSLDIKETGTRM